MQVATTPGDMLPDKHVTSEAQILAAAGEKRVSVAFGQPTRMLSNDLAGLLWSPCALDLGSGKEAK